MSKPWQTSDWRKKRREFLKDKACEWCGSNENLAIHHIKHFKGLREYKRTVTDFIRSYFANGKNKLEKSRLLNKASKDIKAKYFYACPNCGFSVYMRKTITPKYKCSKCGSETDSPIKKESSATRYARLKNFRRLFFKRHRKEIDEMFALRKQQSDRDYRDFKGVEILCKRCHYATERGLVLCEICSQGYHKPNYGKCWNCFEKTDGGKKYLEKKKSKTYNHPWYSKIPDKNGILAISS